VLPTRDRAAMLDGALRAALGQNDVSLEVVVVDEASTDDTGEVLRRAADPRLRIIRHASPSGVAAARNEAIREARGTWIAFLDDDDLWAPGWLRAAMDAGAGKDLVYGARWIIDGERRAFTVGLAEHPDRVPAVLRQYNAIGGPSAVVVRKDVAENAGGFDERLSALADWEAWLRFAQEGRVAAVPELLVGYTTYRQNMHQRHPYRVLNEFHRFV
jgi:O-antigen biosynthesis protein